MLQLKRYSALLLSLLLISCGESTKQDERKAIYIAINGRDTAKLELTRYEKRFYGKMKITRPGRVIDSGEIEGNILKDTLLGNFFYLAHGWKNKKRNPIVLLLKDNQYIQGSGIRTNFMGVPHYVPSSISFKDPKFIYDRVR